MGGAYERKSAIDSAESRPVENGMAELEELERKIKGTVES